jgi:acyl-CoA reductase-like NAD-dependent aldehyde dehydrogenase
MSVMNTLAMHAPIDNVMTRARTVALELRAMPLSKRIEMLKRLKTVVLTERESIMTEIQRETGKCRSDALMSEIFPILDHLDYLIKHASKILADRKAPTPLALMGKKSVIYFEPMGTVLVISPWNYPFYQAIVPCTAAFVTGNAVVYKPSEHTPLKGLVEGVLAKAGFHPEWIQIVYGDGALAQNLINARPDKIFFTGSVNTGKKIMAQAAQYLIPVELELGGKDPMIVFEDVNLDRAVAGAVWGALTNAGQSCTSVERIYVQEKIYEPFKKRLLDEVAKLNQGVDLDGNADFGRMTVPFQIDTIKNHIDDAKRSGAQVLMSAPWDGKNSMVPALVVEGAKPTSKIMTEETFGPVIPIVSFKNEDEVIELANRSEFGLSASVWSADLKRAERVARRLVTGNVSINNVMLTEGNHALPFGGVKSSGFGRYKGEFGLYAFSNIKSVLIDKNSSKIEANWYPYTKKKYELFTSMMIGLFTGGIKGLVQFAASGLRLESYSKAAAKDKTRVARTMTRSS